MFKVGDKVTIIPEKNCSNLLEHNKTYTITRLNYDLVEVKELFCVWFSELNFITITNLRLLKINKIIKLCR